MLTHAHALSGGVKLRLQVLWLLAGLVLLYPDDGTAQHPRYDTYSGFAVDTTPVLPAAEIHPSLYFRADQIDELRARKADPSSRYYDLWVGFRADALRYRDDDMATLNENHRPRAAKSLAFWWIIEADTVAAQKAVEALLLAFDGVPQTGEKPYDEIYRATWLQNYAAAYDWMHDRLTAAEDSTIRAHIANETQYLRDNLVVGDRLAPRPHNHRSKPAWAIGTAALTLSDHAQAADWLQHALEAANSVTRYQFSMDGVYREGGHYWMYNAVNLVPFLWHYRNVSAVDLFDDYRPAFEWPIRVRTGRGQIPNFEDSYLKPAPTHMVAAAYVGVYTDLNPMADFAAICQWNFETTRLVQRDYTGATKDVTWEIDEYILYDSTITAAAPSSNPNQYLESGQVVFRSGWEATPDDRYLLFHGVAEGDNHNHPDQLAFFMAGNDAILVPDAGYGPNGFSDDRRSSWYTTAKAHNIVTADGYPPVTDSLYRSPFVYNVTPPSRYHMDAPFFAFAEKESGYLRPNDARLRRGISFVNREYFVVADLALGSQAHVYRSYLHGRGTFQRTGHHASWTPFENSYGVAARLDAFFFPHSADIAHATGYISLFKDERYERYVEVSQSGTQAAFLQLLTPAAVTDPAPEAEDLSGDAYVAARIKRGSAVDYYLLQAERTQQTLADFSTDATLAWMRLTGDVWTHLAVRESQALSAGSMAFSALAPVTLAMDASAATVLRLAVPEEQPRTEIRLRFAGAAAVQEVTVNDQSVHFSQQGDELTIGVGATEALQEIIPEGRARIEVYPNPFVERVTLHGPGAQSGPFAVAVFNVLGQQIRLLRGASGDHALMWDGRTAQGTRVPAGVYFLQWTEASGAVYRGRVLRLR